MGQDAAGAVGGLSQIAGIAGGPIGMGVSAAANIGMSLVEASKQKDLQRAADRAAENAAKEQRRLLGQNFFEGLQVPTQAYDRAFMQNLASEQQAVSALQEGDPRLLLGGLGKVHGVTLAENAANRADLEGKIFDLDKLKAQEAGQTAEKLASLEGGILAGAQEASAAARAARLQSQQGALEAGGKFITGLSGTIPEYSGTNADGAMKGVGSNIFNDQLKYQQGNFLPSTPSTPIGFGSNRFAAVSMPAGIGN